MIASAPEWAQQSVVAEQAWLDENRRFDLALERNARLLELARHNGYPIEFNAGDNRAGLKFWHVPAELVRVAGYNVAVVR